MMENSDKYTNMHRGFLQVCANHGSIEIGRAKEIFQAHWATENDTHALEKDLRNAIELINKQLGVIEQKISFITSDCDGKEYLIFINTYEAAMDKIQIIYTEPEVHYFRLLQAEIVQSEDFQIRSITALNMTAALTEFNLKLSKNRAEELLEVWCDEGYFIDNDGMLMFGPRTQGEFGEFLQTNFSDFVKVCSLCKTSLFKGISCAEENCESLFHKHCLQKFLAKKANCPCGKNSVLDTIKIPL